MRRKYVTALRSLQLILLACVISSCSTPGWYIRKYNLKLDSVEINQEEKIIVSNSNTFSNELVDINIDILERRFILVNVNNKSNLPITIDWYKFSFIDSENQVMPLKFKRETPVTTIPPKTRVSMSDLIYFHRKYNYHFNTMYPKFTVSDVLPFVFTESVEQRNALVEYYIGKSVSFYLPLTFGDNTTINYRINLSIESINIRQNNPDTFYKVYKKEDFPVLKK